MIVVDTNVIAYLYVPDERSVPAAELLRSEPEWAAPLVWRSELRSVLVKHLRTGRLDLDAAQAIQAAAERLLDQREFMVDSPQVLSLAAESGCSAYDCEFVALAEYLDVPLVSADRRLVERFPARVQALG